MQQVQFTLAKDSRNQLSMQNWYSKLKFSSFLFVFGAIPFIILFENGCTNYTSGVRNPVIKAVKTSTETDGYVSNINFHSFQNSDSSWGFTVFVNSKPYLQYRKIPFLKTSSGFRSKNDAEKVATLFINTIEKGDLTPELNEKLLDSLGISLK
jgi:hypothetical protein